MKRYMAAALMLCCLTGCTGTKSVEAPSDKVYHIADISAEREVFESYRKLVMKNSLDRGSVDDEQIEKQFLSENSRTEGEAKEFLGAVKETDTEKMLDGMDDITNEIFVNAIDGVKVYRDKKYRNMRVVKEQKRLNNYGEILLYAEEYKDRIKETEKNTGLIYSGGTLGRTDDLSDYEEVFAEDGKFTGKNIITFSNDEYALLGQVKDAVYKNVPMKISFYMDDDEVKYIYICLVSGKNIPDRLTEKNIAQLGLGGDMGEAAKTLAEKCFDSDQRQKGDFKNIKYEYMPNCTSEQYGMYHSILVLKF